MLLQDGSNLCQSSRYLDSSDDEDDPRSPEKVKRGNGNEESISTTGQIDDGQFRLVPNDPEDDFFNQRNPPLSTTSKGGLGKSSKAGGRGQVKGKSSSRPVPEAGPGPSSAANFGNDALMDFDQDGQPVPGPSSRLGANKASKVTKSTSGQGQEAQPFLESFSGNDNHSLDEPPLSSSFNAIDAESSFGAPIDLEDIQLQKFLPEHYQNPPTQPHPSSSFKPGGENGSSALPMLQLPDMKSDPSSSGRSANGLSMGMAFTGIPTIVKESERSVKEVGAEAEAGTSSSAGQHSSILESMTGPLSKRLRTLHTLQQKQGCSSSGSSTSEATKTNQSPPSASPAAPSRSKESHQDPPNPDSEDNSNHSNNGDSFLGGTQQSYSVLIETTGPGSGIMKPKRLFEQKSLSDSDYGLHQESTFLSDMLQKDPTEEQDDADEDALMLPNELVSPSTCRSGRTKKTDSSPSPLLISDTPVQSRARASLPTSHLLIKELKAEEGDTERRQCGIFAKKRIPKSCRFGPVEGKLRSADASGGHESLTLLIKSEAGDTHVDTTDESE